MKRISTRLRLSGFWGSVLMIRLCRPNLSESEVVIPESEQNQVHISIRQLSTPPSATRLSPLQGRFPRIGASNDANWLATDARCGAGNGGAYTSPSSREYCTTSYHIRTSPSLTRDHIPDLILDPSAPPAADVTCKLYCTVLRIVPLISLRG